MAMFTSPKTPEEVALKKINSVLMLGIHEAVWACLLAILFTLIAYKAYAIVKRPKTLSQKNYVLFAAISGVFFLYLIGLLERQTLSPGFKLLPFIGLVFYGAFRAILKAPEKLRKRIKRFAIPVVSVLIALHISGVYVWLANKPTVCCRTYPFKVSDPPYIPGAYVLFNIPAFNCEGDCP